MSTVLLDPPVGQDGDVWSLVSSLREEVARLQREIAELRCENRKSWSLREEVARLQREVAELRCEAGYWKSCHARAVERNKKLEEELKQAKAEIRDLKDQLYGRKSEKSKKKSKDRSHDLDDPQASNGEKKTNKKRGQQPHRPGPSRRDYSHLPVREETVELPESERGCPHCGKPFAERSDSEDSEQIEIEIIIYRRRIKRQRYEKTCDCAGCKTITAPTPPKLIPKGRYGISIWTHLLLEKFDAQRPMHRVLQQLRWHGLELAAGTVTGGLKRMEPLFAPIYEALRRRQMQSTHFQADETRWLVFAERAGKTGHRWWLWAFLGEDTVVYVLDPSRSHEVPEQHFPDNAQGVLMVDRYIGYKVMKQVREGGLQLAFCWAHVRRDFVRLGKSLPELKEWALSWLRRIRELYRLNRKRLEQDSGSEAFAQADAALRQHVESMQTARDEALADPSLRKPCRTALASLQEHWQGLTLFVDDPRIPLDNNRSERCVRNPALGRKNYYGSAAEWSGRLAAMMFSIFATLLHWGLNPRVWLSWYLEACAQAGGKAPADIEPFLPWNLSEERQAALAGKPSSPEPADTS